MRHMSHSLGSPILDRTVLDDMNPCCQESILEDKLCHKSIYSTKIELNKLIYNTEVKTATTIEELLDLFYINHMKCFNLWLI